MVLPKKETTQYEKNLAGTKHEHRLIPIEYGHPITVANGDVPSGLTTENVAIIQMRGSRFGSLSGNDFRINDWVAAFNRLKDRYGDCFDFVVFFTDPRLPRIPYSGYHRGIYNEVTGINRNNFNNRSTWGSDRLQSQIWMGRFSLGTLLQEIGHRWGAFARYQMTRTGSTKNDLMLPGGAHWARQFDDGNSPMDYDEERHVRRNITTWLREPIGGLEFTYCNLDLYLMGLMKRREVGRFTLIQKYTEIGAVPGGRMLIRGIAKNLTIRNIVWAEGARTPSQQNSQKNFKAAFVVITRNANRLDDLFVRKVELMRQQVEQYFQLASKNRACIDTRLCCGNNISQRGKVNMVLPADRIVRKGPIYHGLGPIPVKVELGFESTIGGRPIDIWTREETPDITRGVQQLSAQVKRDPYDGTFEIIAQAKGRDLRLNMIWWAGSIS